MTETLRKLFNSVEAHGFTDELGHPLLKFHDWSRMRDQLSADERDELYTVEDGWAELHSGEPFSYREPTVDMIHLTDIANSLGKMCRYGGHVHTFYTVAEHSCLMMRWARENIGRMNHSLLRTILLHDAVEALTGVDMNRPLKHMTPSIKNLEAHLEPLIAEKFDLIHPHPLVVRELDTRILVDERAQAMNPSNNEWGIDSIVGLGVRLNFWDPDEAIANFLGDFEEVKSA